MTTIDMRFRYQQIASAIRDHARLHLQPGDMLDPELELASRFKVSHKTVRQALEVLVDEGWIQRHRGRGTVLVDRLTTGEFAVVASPDLLNADQTPFYPLAIQALMDEAQQWNARIQCRIHLGRPGISDWRLFPQTTDLLDPRVFRNLRGVFTFKPLLEVGQALEEQGVPVIKIGQGPKYSIRYDAMALLRMGLEHLAGRGARRVALMWAGNSKAETPPQKCFEGYRQIAAALGLETQPQWLVTAETLQVSEQLGYELFQKLWGLAQRPSGLLVLDDVLCRGVLRGALQHGLRLGENLKLITHANEGASLPYHQPVTRLEVSPRLYAQRAVDMMKIRVQKHSQDLPNVEIPIRLMMGQTT